MRKLLLTFFLILTSIPVLANDLKEIVAAKDPLQKRVMLIVDVSGSMISSHTNCVAEALGNVGMIVNQPVDEMDLALIVFNSNTRRWPGVPEPGTKKGWAKLPSVEAGNKARDFVQNAFEDSGTYFAPAFKLALEEQSSDFTIVVITDGTNAFESEATIVRVTAEAQTLREAAGLEAIPIWIIDTNSTKNEWAVTLAKTYGGGYWIND